METTIDITKDITKMSRKKMCELVQQKPVHRNEIRFYVDMYYQLQGFRLVATNQIGAAGRSVEPFSDFAGAVHKELHKVEDRLAVFLDVMICETAIGSWAKSIVGVGPVIAAGLLAHIDIAKAPTVGHIWRFAGLDPTQQWLGAVKAKALVTEIESKDLSGAIPGLAQRIGCKEETLRKFATSDIAGKKIKLTAESLTKAAAKRPWNAALKVICWKLGESFVKTHNLPDGYYGHIYAARKVQEEARNAAGMFAAQAAGILAQKRIGKSTDAYKAYAAGKLPPAHLHARAKRYAVKLFLAHYHWVAYEAEYGTDPPKPYVIEHLGHSALLRPPNWKS